MPADGSGENKGQSLTLRGCGLRAVGGVGRLPELRGRAPRRRRRVRGGTRPRSRHLGAQRGVYHALRGKLSPISRVGPEQLSLASLLDRVRRGEVRERILALSNDVEGEATCHHLTSHLPPGGEVRVSRIGFGLPSGGGVPYADSVTLRSALDGRRSYS